MADKSGIRACIDRVIPQELQAIARAKAVEENPANAPTAFEMALVTGKRWKPGRSGAARRWGSRRWPTTW